MFVVAKYFGPTIVFKTKWETQLFFKSIKVGWGGGLFDGNSDLPLDRFSTERSKTQTKVITDQSQQNKTK